MDAPLRILYCSDTFPPQVNGVSVVAAATIAGMQRRGWLCGVVSPRYPKPYGAAFAGDAPDLARMPLHVKVPSVPLPPYPDIRVAAPVYAWVRNAVQTFRPHLVHCQTEFVLGRLGQRAAREFGVPAVSSYHTDFSRYTEAYRVGWLRDRVTRYIAAFHRRSRRVYTPSAHARNDLARIGVHSVEVWGRGVDTRQFHPAQATTTQRSAISEAGTFVFLHVGRLAPEKNADVMLEAYQLLRARRPDLATSLVIAGDGPSAAALRTRAGAGVRFLGNLDRQSVLPGLYASADAFVYSSETETLGLVVLEAMASGLPVIATPAGGVADNLRDGLNGLAYRAGNATDMAQAMEQIATDTALREKLREGARRWAESRSWEAELDRLDASYRDVLCLRERIGGQP